MATNKLDLWKYAKMYEKNLIKWVNKSLKVLKEEIDFRSPEDTLDFIQHNDIFEAENVGGEIIGSVYNDSEHNIWVEIWFKSYDVNWSKKDWKFIRRWTGARPFTLSFDTKQEEIKDIIIKELKIW